MGFHKDIEAAGGLFVLCALKMKERRASLPAQQGHWAALPPESRLKERPVAPRRESESFGKPRPLEPVKPLTNLATADNVDEQDQELDELLKEDMPSEISVSKPLPHEDAELLMDEVTSEEPEVCDAE